MAIILLIITIIMTVLAIYASLHIIAEADYAGKERDEWINSFHYHNELTLRRSHYPNL